MYNAELALSRDAVKIKAGHIVVLIALQYPPYCYIIKKEVEELYNSLLQCSCNARSKKVIAKYRSLAQKLCVVYFEQEKNEQTAQEFLNLVRAISL